jgi:hypothetical protein
MDSNTKSLIKKATIADTKKEMKTPENNRKQIKAEVTVLSKKIDALNSKLHHKGQDLGTTGSSATNSASNSAANSAVSGSGNASAK